MKATAQRASPRILNAMAAPAACSACEPMGTHQGKSWRGLGEVVAALVAAPVEEDLGHLHAAPELRAVFAIHGNEHVLRAHGRADADVRGLVAEAGGVGAELAGALQVDGLGVERAHQHHQPVHAHELGRIAREVRQRTCQSSVRVEQLVILDFEFSDRANRGILGLPDGGRRCGL